MKGHELGYGCTMCACVVCVNVIETSGTCLGRATYSLHQVLGEHASWRAFGNPHKCKMNYSVRELSMRCAVAVSMCEFWCKTADTQVQSAFMT